MINWKRSFPLEILNLNYLLRNRKNINLGNIIEIAKYINFDNEKKTYLTWSKISQTTRDYRFSSKRFKRTFRKKEKYENILKYFYYLKMKTIIKMQS